MTLARHLKLCTNFFGSHNVFRHRHILIFYSKRNVELFFFFLKIICFLFPPQIFRKYNQILRMHQEYFWHFNSYCICFMKDSSFKLMMNLISIHKIFNILVQSLLQSLTCCVVIHFVSGEWLSLLSLVGTSWVLRPMCGGGEEPEGAVSVPRSHASSPVRRQRTTQDTKAM